MGETPTCSGSINGSQVPPSGRMPAAPLMFSKNAEVSVGSHSNRRDSGECDVTEPEERPGGEAELKGEIPEESPTGESDEVKLLW